MFRSGTVFVCCLFFGQSVLAQEFRFAKIERAEVDWSEVGRIRVPQIPDNEFGRQIHVALEQYFRSDPQLSDVQARRLAVLNAFVAQIFPNVPNSSVPVLLPVNIDTYLSDAASECDKDAVSKCGKGDTSEYLLSAEGKYVDAPQKENSGYDAQFKYNGRLVTISASRLLYEVPDVKLPKVVEGTDYKDLIIEGERRLAFERFGVPYVISVDCSDPKDCDEAGELADRVFRQLRFVGGTPSAQKLNPRSGDPPQPVRLNKTFTYMPPGQLLAKTGSGRRSYTVYAWFGQDGFPLAEGPAYANTQYYGDWGDCEGAKENSGTTYECKRTGQTLVDDEGSKRNYSYPWRDNFCETGRSYATWTCLDGKGHQGQDIRPSTCVKGNGGTSCEPSQPDHDVIAVWGGQIIKTGTEALIVSVNTHRDRYRVRYLHMDPDKIKKWKTGDGVRQGQVLGEVGNWMNKQKGRTSNHLHFEVYVPTRYGWVHVNPYPSLVLAYEWRLNARGREVQPGE